MESSFPPEEHDVVVFTSRPAGDDRRSFTLEEDPTGRVELDPEDLQHEDDLVEAMDESGFQLTMVGGGSRGEDVRRFYFRIRG